MSQELDRRGALTERTSQLERMIEIRAFEDATRELFAQGLVHGTTHTCHGQEAVAVGVASVVKPADLVTCTYRGHGHALALGMTPHSVLGEIAGRTMGCGGGLGGSMHLCSREVGLLPTFAIVGAGIPVAAGAAYAAQVRGGDDIAVGIFGDGATNIGAFHEGMNLAAIWKLPVLFICENNVYGEYSRINLTTPIEDIAQRGSSYAMTSHIVDGQDVDVVHREVSSVVDEIRSSGAPAFIEMKTYRYAGHSRADAATYRPEGELDDWMTRDPIATFEQRLIDEAVLTTDEVAALHRDVEARIASVVEEVLASPEPDVAAMFDHIYAEQSG